MKLNNKMMNSGGRKSNSFVVDVDVVSMTMLLLLSSYLSSLPGVMANLNITFACWSTAVNETCNFRTFSEIGGELVMMDTVSKDIITVMILIVILYYDDIPFVLFIYFSYRLLTFIYLRIGIKRFSIL